MKDEMNNLIEAQLLAAKFLSIVEEKMVERKMTKAALAKAVGTSSSYITQLFMADRLPNFKILAKFKSILDLDFVILSEEHLDQIINREIESRKKPWNNSLKNILHKIETEDSSPLSIVETSRPKVNAA